MKKKILFLNLTLLIIVLVVSLFNNKVFAETKNGWVKENKKWYYYEGGTKKSNGKFEIDGEYYFFYFNGVMRTQGWYNSRTDEDPKWYYITESGVCAIGWRKISGKWYYFSPDNEIGLMVSNSDEEIDGKKYVFKKSGEMVENGWAEIRGKYCVDNYSNPNNFTWWFYIENEIAVTGWKKINGVWYYFDTYTGIMKDDPTTIDGKVWCFDNLGKWIENPNGWYKNEIPHHNGKLIDIQWYYFEGQNGVKDTWKTIDGKEYHFDSSGRMSQSTFVEKNGKKYFVDSSGALVENIEDGWLSAITSYGTEFWRYFENGEAVTGWKDIGGKTYYFNQFGTMVTGATYITDENGEQKLYGFDNSGALVNNQWIKNEYKTNFGDYTEYTETDLHYFDENGINVEKKNCWADVDGSRYYFNEAGSIFYGGTMTIDGKLYLFDNSGKCIMKKGWQSVRREVRTTYFGDNTAGTLTTEIFWYWVKNNQGEVLEEDWITENGKKYYASFGGAIYTDTVVQIINSNGISEGKFAFDSSGALVKNNWFEAGVKCWYYIDENGQPVENQWKKSGDTWYYLDATGKTLKNCTAEINGKYYAFDENSKMIAKTGWNSFKDEDGLLVWVYVLNKDGEIKTSSTLKENGKTYNFGTNGIWEE